MSTLPVGVRTGPPQAGEFRSHFVYKVIDKRLPGRGGQAVGNCQGADQWQSTSRESPSRS